MSKLILPGLPQPRKTVSPEEVAAMNRIQVELARMLEDHTYEVAWATLATFCARLAMKQAGPANKRRARAILQAFNATTEYMTDNAP